MKCIDCGGEMGQPIKRTTGFRALPGVSLHGVSERVCLHCGESEIEVPDVAGLERNLATAVASRPGRLSGQEVRFLRRHLDWSGKAFAEAFSAAPETVSRWENGDQRMDVRTEVLLRLSVLRDQLPSGTATEVLVPLFRLPHADPTGGPDSATWDGLRWRVATSIVVDEWSKLAARAAPWTDAATVRVAHHGTATFVGSRLVLVEPAPLECGPSVVARSNTSQEAA